MINTLYLEVKLMALLFKEPTTMTEKEINEACAEEIGRQKTQPKIMDACLCHWVSPNGDCRISRPDCLTDANATLSLIEHLRRAKGIEMHSITNGNQAAEWVCGLRGIGVHIVALSKTFQRAVCIGFLKAVGRYRE